MYLSLCTRYEVPSSRPDLLVARLAPGDVDRIRARVRQTVRGAGPMAADDGALLVVAGATAMRGEGAHARWTVVTDWLGLSEHQIERLERLYLGMKDAAADFGFEIVQAEVKQLFLGTMFRYSGQLWRQIRAAVDSLGADRTHWARWRMFGGDDWLSLLAAECSHLLDALEGQGRSALVERMMDLAWQRARLDELGLRRSTLDSTIAAAGAAGLDLCAHFEAPNDHELRALLGSLYAFQGQGVAQHAAPAGAAQDPDGGGAADAASWCVVRQNNLVALGVRLPRTLVGEIADLLLPILLAPRANPTRPTVV